VPRRTPVERSRRPARAVVALVAAAFAAGTVVGVGVTRRPPASPTEAPRVERTPSTSRQAPQASGPRLERPSAARPSPTGPQPPVGRVAIIFDDAGGSLEDVEAIIAIGRPVTVSVLPGLAYSSEVARRARAAGLEVLLHLPMEPDDGTRPLGPDGVTAAMDDAEIRATVRRALGSVPGAIGINNHMGSRGTADPRVMRAVLETAKAEGLFFVDSRTTVRTVVIDVAAAVGVPAASRTLFLDNDETDEAILHEIRRLMDLARTRGAAIAIGHAQRRTPRLVAAMRDEFDRRGVAIVPLSTLVR
jgi:polysaccharide deacetylase 2 family uncharacterized protein YibQ